MNARSYEGAKKSTKKGHFPIQSLVFYLAVASPICVEKERLLHRALFEQKDSGTKTTSLFSYTPKRDQ